MVQHLRITRPSHLLAAVACFLFAIATSSFAQSNAVSVGSTPIEAVDGSISGAVFVDLNASNDQDFSERGLAFVVLNLHALNTDGTIAFSRTLTSNEDGHYTFSGLATGRYRVVADSDGTMQPIDATVDITEVTQNVIGSIACRGVAANAPISDSSEPRFE